MTFPWALAGWTTLGALTAYRTFVRPYRGVVRDGQVTACPGPGCSAGLTVQSTRGVATVFSLVTGTVTAVGSDYMELASAREPVVIRYQGAGLKPMVGVGGAVKIGQPVAAAQAVTLTVGQIDRDPSGKLSMLALEPATWLASRGLTAASHLTPSALWCAQGRKLVVPMSVGTCGVRLPDPASFALLPTSSRLA